MKNKRNGMEDANQTKNINKADRRIKTQKKLSENIDNLSFEILTKVRKKSPKL